MSIPTLDWSSDDAANLRAFFQTRTGQRLLPKLLEATPNLFSDGETNKILIRMGEVRGCNILSSALISLTTIEPPPPQDAAMYPSLDDDAAWNDGKKLNPEQE